MERELTETARTSAVADSRPDSTRLLKRMGSPQRVRPSKIETMLWDSGMSLTIGLL